MIYSNKPGYYPKTTPPDEPKKDTTPKAKPKRKPKAKAKPKAKKLDYDKDSFLMDDTKDDEST